MLAKVPATITTEPPQADTNNPLLSVNAEVGWVLASCLIYARALLEYVIIIMWLRSVIKMFTVREIRGR